MPAPATLRLLGDPLQAGRPNAAPSICYLPSALPARDRGPGGGAGFLREKALRRRLTCRPPLLQRHPDTAPSRGMNTPASRPGRPRQGWAGDLLPRPPPPPPLPGLRLRRLRGWISRGTACSEGYRPRALTRAGASASRRPAVRAAGRLGAARGAASPTADGHVSVPFFFFFFSSPPPSAPFHRTALSYPPPSPFPTAGAGGTGREGGVGTEGVGAGQRWAPPPGRGEPAFRGFPLPARPDPLVVGYQPSQPATP